MKFPVLSIFQPAFIWDHWFLFFFKYGSICPDSQIIKILILSLKDWGPQTGVGKISRLWAKLEGTKCETWKKASANLGEFCSQHYRFWLRSWYGRISCPYQPGGQTGRRKGEIIFLRIYLILFFLAPTLNNCINFFFLIQDIYRWFLFI